MSPEQRERHRRILRAAARHGAAFGLDRVQMHDVARDAGVAIATLYRYFPSKTHLFTALMQSQVERLAELDVHPQPGETPDQGVARLLVAAGRNLLANPRLTHAMMQSNNAMVAQAPSAAVTEIFSQVMLDAGGIEDPTPYDLRLLRIIEEAWYGIIIAALNRGDDPALVEADTVLICRLLLRDRTEPAD